MMMAPTTTNRRRFALLLLGLLGSTSITITSGFAPIIISPTTTRQLIHHNKQKQQHQPQSNNNNQFLLLSRSSSSAIAISSSTTSLHAALFQIDEETSQKLILLTFEKAIEAGIPALFFIGTTIWFISMMKSQRDGGDNGGGMMMGGRGGGGRRRGGSSRAAGGGAARRSNKGKRGGGGMFNGGQSSKLGPVEELYDDIYDDLSGPDDNNVPPLLKLLSGGGGSQNNQKNGIDRPTSKLNIGIPKQQYLKVSKLNSKYDSYRYSMVSATRGKAVAASELRSKGFESALWKALGVTTHNSNSGSDGALLGKLTASEATALITLERDFLSDGSELLEDVALLSREITNAAVLDEMEEMGVEPGVIDAEVVVVDDDDEKKKGIDDVTTTAQKEFFGITTSSSSSSTAATTEKKSGGEDDKKKKAGAGLQTDIMKAIKEVEAINTQIMLLELDFIQDIVEILGPNRADTIRTTIVGNMIAGEAGTLLKTLKGRPLATVLSSFNGGGGGVEESNAGKNLYVTRFPGDVTASQLNELREEVTGILQVAQPGDEALLVLQSGGGTVTGYGLAAAQLQRFKAKNIKLTVCVEQVAASGGYMMCCTADRIVASPFAVLGSIGVISEVPNAYERLQREGRIVASPFAVLGSIGVISEVPNAYERLQREGIEFATITAGKYKRTVTP